MKNKEVTISLEEYKELLLKERPSDNDKWVLEKIKEFIVNHSKLSDDCKSISIESDWRFSEGLLKYLKLIDMEFYKALVKKCYDNKLQEKRKAKYEKEKLIKEQYDKQIIDNKLKEKYIDKPIMINRYNEWEKTKVKEIYATNKGIYLRPYLDGHICKLSREGHTWKMWSELEELETQKQELERRIKEIKDKTEDLESQV